MSRLPLSVDATILITTAQGEEREQKLEKLLKETTADRLDLSVNLSAKGHRVRLVAVRASEQESQKRRRERKVKVNGKATSQKALIRDGWLASHGDERGRGGPKCGRTL